MFNFVCVCFCELNMFFYIRIYKLDKTLFLAQSAADGFFCHTVLGIGWRFFRVLFRRLAELARRAVACVEWASCFERSAPITSTLADVPAVSVAV